MKKNFNQKLELNSGQIQQLTSAEAKKVVGGNDFSSGVTQKFTLGTWPPTTINWEGTASWPV